jgi:hypothetical protein
VVLIREAYHNEFSAPERIIERGDTTGDLAVVFRKTEVERYSDNNECYCDRPSDCCDNK